MRLRKKKPKQIIEPPKATDKPKKYITRDFGAIKDFISFGANRTLNDLKLRRMVDVKIREERMKGKGQKDWQQIMIMVLIIVIVGAIAFTLITQFFNYQDMAQQNAGLIMELARCHGQLQSGVSPPAVITG